MDELDSENVVEQPHISAAPEILLDPSCAHLLRIGANPSVAIPDNVALRKGVLTIGRNHDGTDIWLDSTRMERMISRHHATLIQDEDGSWRVKDANSANGTFVNGKRITNHSLKDEDVLIFGRPDKDSEFKFRFIAAKNPVISLDEPPRKRVRTEESAQSASDAADAITVATQEEEHRRLKEVELQAELKEKAIMELQEELEKARAAIEQERYKKDQLELVKKQLDELKSQQQQAEAEQVEAAGLQQLQQDLEERKRQTEELLKKTASTDGLQEELRCSICSCLFVDAHTIECAHSFCGSCIKHWLTLSKTCPVCRSTVQREPVRCITLDNAIAKLLESLPPAERQDVMQRKQELEKQRAQVDKLKQLIAQARTKGKTFLSILDRWRPEDRKVFQTGLKLYCGEARLVYCGLTRLTYDYIRTATLQHLKLAADNVGISVRAGQSAEDLRRLLQQFLRGD